MAFNNTLVDTTRGKRTIIDEGVFSPRVNKEQVMQYAQPYGYVSKSEWDDWRWQVQNRIVDYSKLCEIIEWKGEEKNTIQKVERKYPQAVTPYIASKLWHYLQHGPMEYFNALRSIYVPQHIEETSFIGDAIDGTGEDISSSAPHSHQFYSDRILIRLNSMCPALCRYCYVRRKVDVTGRPLKKATVKGIAEYVQNHHEIRDVILSGGDPLLVSDDYLAWVLKCFHEIPHVGILRIDTKVPNTLPQRITDDFSQLLARFNPIYINIHISHPCELTEEMRDVCARLADHGIVLSAHIPLLRNINDSFETIENLVVKLLESRIRPYLLIQYIKTEGAEHFGVPISKGLEIMKQLWGNVSGLALPAYVLYLPSGGGKVPLFPQSIVGQKANLLHVMNHRDELYQYESPTE